MHLTRRWECCAGARWRRLIINTNKSFPDTLVLLLLPPLSLLNPEPRRKAELERLKELKCPGGGEKRIRAPRATSAFGDPEGGRRRGGEGEASLLRGQQGQSQVLLFRISASLQVQSLPVGSGAFLGVVSLG